MNEDPEQREEALRNQIKLVARYKEKIQLLESIIGDLHLELLEDLDKFRDQIKFQLDQIIGEDPR